jgi:hypothetical protein
VIGFSVKLGPLAFSVAAARVKHLNEAADQALERANKQELHAEVKRKRKK